VLGARSWLRCDWSIYIIGRGLAKYEFKATRSRINDVVPNNRRLKRLKEEM